MITNLYSPIEISSFFIGKSLDEGEELTNMKVLKLVYIAHGWHLGITGEPLINEAVKAWKYGPVIETIYNKFKGFKARSITIVPERPNLEQGDAKINYVDFLEKIWEVYKGFTALQLSTLTHQNNTPWDITMKKSGEFAIIPNDLIEDHYKKRIPSSVE